MLRLCGVNYSIIFVRGSFCIDCLRLLYIYMPTDLYLWYWNMHPSSLKLDLLWRKVEHRHAWKGFYFELYVLQTIYAGLPNRRWQQNVAWHQIRQYYYSAFLYAPFISNDSKALHMYNLRTHGVTKQIRFQLSFDIQRCGLNTESPTPTLKDLLHYR